MNVDCFLVEGISKIILLSMKDNDEEAFLYICLLH